MDYQRSTYKKGKLPQDRVDRLVGIDFDWTPPRGGTKRDWETRFKELVQYKAKHGDCDVPAKQGQLGRWVANHRATYKKGKLPQDRINRLVGIDFEWTPPIGRKGDWETRFNELVQYKAKHGDCNVPLRQGQLGRWVNKQRFNYKKGELSQGRIHRLDGIGFDWTLTIGGPRKKKPPSSISKSLSRNERSRPQVPWETRFNKLVQYKAKHGDCNVPQRQGPLGTWVSKQKTNYRKGKLSQDRVDRLNAIGFDWAPGRGVK